MADFEEIKAEYIRGGVSYRKLAEKYGVSFSTLRKKADKEKWRELRDRARAKSDTKTVNAISTQKAKRNAKIDKATEKLLDCIIEMIQDRSIFAISRGVSDVTRAIKDIREIKGEINDLDYKEQMARIKKLQKETRSDEGDKKINVVIAADLDEFTK